MMGREAHHAIILLPTYFTLITQFVASTVAHWRRQCFYSFAEQAVPEFRHVHCFHWMPELSRAYLRGNEA